MRSEQEIRKMLDKRVKLREKYWEGELELTIKEGNRLDSEISFLVWVLGEREKL